MTFTLHSNLQTKAFIIDLPLCRVLLEDNAHYPWIFLVPRRPNISRIMDLKPKDQLLLMQEMDWAQHVLWKKFEPTQLNVAAIGNKTPQLHVHVIARNVNDPAWPGTVWDHPAQKAYGEEERQRMCERLASSLNDRFRQSQSLAHMINAEG